MGHTISDSLFIFFHHDPQAPPSGRKEHTSNGRHRTATENEAHLISNSVYQKKLGFSQQQKYLETGRVCGAEKWEDTI